MKFLVPTLLNSMEPQCGQQVENLRSMAWSMVLTLALRPAVRGRSALVSDRRRGVDGLGTVPPSACRPAFFPCGPDLLRCSQVRFRECYPFFCARNLALVSLE